MKKLILILIQVLIMLSLYAQSPQKMSYQAVIRNQNNNLVKNSAVGMRVSILQGSATGDVVFQELYNPNPVTNDNGLVGVEIGNGTALQGAFGDIDWGNGTYFLKTETDPTGGTNYTVTGVSQLLSVPYALFSAETAQTYSAGTGIAIADGLITNTAPNVVHTGDATGSDHLTVTAIQGRSVQNKTPTFGQVLQWSLDNKWAPTTLPGATPGWSLTGNNGIDPAVNFMGTTDEQPLIFKINNQHAGEINFTTGNTSFGLGSLQDNPTGIFNTAIGYEALTHNTTGKINTAIGGYTLSKLTTGECNTAVGYYAGNSNITGNRNVFLGYTAGINETGSDKLYIANSPTDPPLIFGDFATKSVGIGTKIPHNSAAVEIASTTKGFLPPRMTKSQRTAIASPAAGLLVFQTDAPSGYYYFTGTTWINMMESAGSTSCIDYDDNAYPTINIGTQVWMAENLRVTHYKNGDPIALVENNTTWTTTSNGAYCWYENNPSAYGWCGAMYNWYAATDSHGLCPEGWHLPNSTEWNTFRDYLGGQYEAGGKMKSLSGFWFPNSNATNNSGFSGLPVGFRGDVSGGYAQNGDVGYFWSGTAYSTSNAYRRWLSDVDGWLHSDYADKNQGLSVRCIKD